MLSHLFLDRETMGARAGEEMTMALSAEKSAATQVKAWHPLRQRRNRKYFTWVETFCWIQFGQTFLNQRTAGFWCWTFGWLELTWVDLSWDCWMQFGLYVWITGFCDFVGFIMMMSNSWRSEQNRHIVDRRIFRWSWLVGGMDLHPTVRSQSPQLIGHHELS